MRISFITGHVIIHCFHFGASHQFFKELEDAHWSVEFELFQKHNVFTFEIEENRGSFDVY